MMLTVLIPGIAFLLCLCIKDGIAMTNDDLFLSKCVCHSDDYQAPDCNFSKLSKKKLLLLAKKLSKHKIVCINSEGYMIPSFTTSTTTEESPSKKQTATVDAKTSAMEVTGASAQPQAECTINGHIVTNRRKGIEYLFPTTLMVGELIRDEKSDQYNEDLKELLLELEAEGDGCDPKFEGNCLAMEGGFRTSDNFLTRREPSIQWLLSHIYPRVNALLGLSNSANIPYSVVGWGAVLRGGDGVSAHVHPDSLYAGVYYVAAPAELASSGGHDGCIRFLDPRMGASMAQVVRGKSLYGEQAEICPDERGGLLIIFPSWLMHEVKPMLEEWDDPRIAISFNVVSTI